jgi:hypothetical protein
MTSVHYSENVVRDQAAQAVKKKTRKWAVLGAGLGVALAGGAAWAAVTLYGAGDADVAATELKPLTVDNIQTTGPLLPGETVGAKGAVHNPNAFPVRVTAVIIRAEGLQGVGAGCNEPGVLIPKGTPGNYGTGIGQGWKTTLTEPVTVAKNGGGSWVEIEQAVAQKAGTTMTCGFKAKIAVEALAGN